MWLVDLKIEEMGKILTDGKIDAASHFPFLNQAQQSSGRGPDLLQ
jgi:hypothetical protein